MTANSRDTCQRQDVLLSNQRHQNEKIGIDEFPLPVPLLDDDPFASLSLSPLPILRLWRLPPLVMKKHPATNMRKMKTTMMTSDLPSSNSFFSLFCALMPKGEKNIYLSCCHVVD
jgi:hypothetical protein